MKTILYHSNSSKAFTGFGKNAKNILKYLHKTKKYEVIEFANGQHWSDPSLELRPWKAKGSLPDDRDLLNSLNQDPQRARQAGYGAEMIDKAIYEFKPDIYIGCEDIWAFGGYWEKPWWDKINHMIWTTLDSQPILPQAIEAAPKTKNFYSWASFAEKDLKKMGHDHVGTLHGSVDTEDFYRFSDLDRQKLRKKFDLHDEFIIGFVFRNQLRKSVPNILEGFKIFKKDCPNAKLLLHTYWKEGWDIPRLIEEKGLSNSDILTTYYCKACGQYEVRSYNGEEQQCRQCGSQNTLNTTNTQHGVNEEQLNEIYNLMDVYCHPFTSGGMEIPIFEAKMTELITLVTDYSCGEDSSSVECGSFPLDWAEYREPGTQFIKASTYPSSIAKQLKKVLQMNPSKRRSMGQKGKKWTIDNYSTEAVGKKLEGILDAMPDHNFDFSTEEQKAQIDLREILDKGKKIAVVIPGSGEDLVCVNSMIDNLKSLYPDHKIYVFTQPDFYAYIEDNENVEMVLKYSSSIDSLFILEGSDSYPGLFDLAFLPHVGTQKFINYTHNGANKHEFELYS